MIVDRVALKTKTVLFRRPVDCLLGTEGFNINWGSEVEAKLILAVYRGWVAILCECMQRNNNIKNSLYALRQASTNGKL
jgi:hypothetical protein